MDSSNNLSLTVWVKLTRYGVIIIDNKGDMGDSEEGYHWQINDYGYMLFMVGNDDDNECDGNYENDCYVKCN